MKERREKKRKKGKKERKKPVYSPPGRQQVGRIRSGNETEKNESKERKKE